MVFVCVQVAIGDTLCVCLWTDEFWFGFFVVGFLFFFFLVVLVLVFFSRQGFSV